MYKLTALLVCLFLLAGCDGSPTGPPGDETPSRPTFVSVSAGDFTVCGLTTDGTVYCWGDFYDTIPTRVPGDYSFRSISAGIAGPWDYVGFHACGITHANRAFCWGDDGSGELGDGGTGGWVAEPVAVGGNLEFADLALGFASTCGIVADGSVFCWGSNTDGELGTPRGWATLPTRVPGDFRFAKLSSGQWFRCGITMDQDTYCWGFDDGDELGDGVREFINPVPTPVVGGEGLTGISSGFDHTCGLRSADGGVMCWGDNGAGQLNDDTRVNRDSAVLSGLNMPTLVSIEAGGDQSCGLTPEGRVYCWGDVMARSGRVLHPRDGPELIAGLPPMKSVTLGEWFACGVSQDGWVYCWGNNAAGQLGRGPSRTGSDWLDWLGPEPITAP